MSADCAARRVKRSSRARLTFDTKSPDTVISLSVTRPPDPSMRWASAMPESCIWPVTMPEVSFRWAEIVPLVVSSKSLSDVAVVSTSRATVAAVARRSFSTVAPLDFSCSDTNSPAERISFAIAPLVAPSISLSEAVDVSTSRATFAAVRRRSFSTVAPLDFNCSETMSLAARISLATEPLVEPNISLSALAEVSISEPKLWAVERSSLRRDWPPASSCADIVAVAPRMRSPSTLAFLVTSSLKAEALVESSSEMPAVAERRLDATEAALFSISTRSSAPDVCIWRAACDAVVWMLPVTVEAVDCINSLMAPVAASSSPMTADPADCTSRAAWAARLRMPLLTAPEALASRSLALALAASISPVTELPADWISRDARIAASFMLVPTAAPVVSISPESVLAALRSSPMTDAPLPLICSVTAPLALCNRPVIEVAESCRRA